MQTTLNAFVGVLPGRSVNIISSGSVVVMNMIIII